MNYDVGSVEQTSYCNSDDKETIVYLYSDTGLVLELVFEFIVSRNQLMEWVDMMNNPLRDSNYYSVDEVHVCDDDTCRVILSCSDFTVNVRAKDCDVIKEFVEDLNNPENVSVEVLWSEYEKLSKEIMLKKQSVFGLEVRRDRILRKLILE